LAKLGHKVVGVDVNENKVRLMNEGKPTIIEEGIAELCQEAHDKGMLSATTVATEGIANTEVSFIVVGTPSSPEGHLNLNYIYTVAGRIGRALKEKKSRGDLNYMHLIAIRSTVLPGTNQKVGEIIAEEGGLERGKDFTVVSNPEFLREGTSVEDYFNPPLTLVGADCEYAEKVFRVIHLDNGHIRPVLRVFQDKARRHHRAILQEAGGLACPGGNLNHIAPLRNLFRNQRSINAAQNNRSIVLQPQPDIFPAGYLREMIRRPAPLKAPVQVQKGSILPQTAKIAFHSGHAIQLFYVRPV
jgi:hypothetical protein